MWLSKVVGLAIIATFTLVYGQTLPPQQGCNRVTFLNCSTNTIGSYLGTDSGELWSSPAKLYARLADMYTITSQSIGDIVTLCNSLAQFYDCLGQQQLDSCLGYIGLINQGLSPADGYAIDGTLSMYLHVCGAGFYMAEDPAIFDCVQNTWRNFRSQTDMLLDSYRSNIAHDITNACKYAQDLQNAWAALFKTKKCNDPGVNRAPAGGFWACASVHAYTTIQFQHCNRVNTCEFAMTFNTRLYVREDEAGRTWVRIPPTWRKDTKGVWYLEDEKWV